MRGGSTASPLPGLPPLPPSPLRLRSAAPRRPSASRGCRWGRSCAGTLSERSTFPAGAKGRSTGSRVLLRSHDGERRRRELEPGGSGRGTGADGLGVGGEGRAGLGESVGDSGRPPTLPASPSLQEEPAAAGRGDFAAAFAFSEKEAAAGAGSGAWAEALGQLKRKVSTRGGGGGGGGRVTLTSRPSCLGSAAPPAWMRRSRR